MKGVDSPSVRFDVIALEPQDHSLRMDNQEEDSSWFCEGLFYRFVKNLSSWCRESVSETNIYPHF